MTLCAATTSKRQVRGEAMSRNPGVRKKVSRPSSPTLEPRTSAEDLASIPATPGASNQYILTATTGLGGQRLVQGHGAGPGTKGSDDGSS